MVHEHLGEVTTELNMRFCSAKCRDVFIQGMLESTRIDHEHKQDLLERFPHLSIGAGDAERIEGYMSGRHGHSHKASKAMTVPTKSTNAPMGAGLLTWTKRKVSGTYVVDTNRIADILVDMVNYFSDKLSTSEEQIKTNGSAVIAAMIGNIASNGYTNTERAKGVFVGRWTEALRLAGLSQEFFPANSSRSKKVIEKPSLRNKELATEMAVLFSADSAVRGDNDINYLRLSLHLFSIVDSVIRKTGEAGYLFLLMFPVDIRTSVKRGPREIATFEESTKAAPPTAADDDSK